MTNAAALGTALTDVGFRLVVRWNREPPGPRGPPTFDAELTGKVAQEVLDRAGITCNRNTIPDDPRSPFMTCGLRLGSAAQTTAGMGADEMATVGRLIGTRPANRDDEATLAYGARRGAGSLRRLPALPDPGQAVVEPGSTAR